VITRSQDRHFPQAKLLVLKRSTRITGGILAFIVYHAAARIGKASLGGSLKSHIYDIRHAIVIATFH
jgi:hypothetical protein